MRRRPSEVRAIHLVQEHLQLHPTPSWLIILTQPCSGELLRDGLAHPTARLRGRIPAYYPLNQRLFTGKMRRNHFREEFLDFRSR